MNEIEIYKTDLGNEIKVQLINETVWLSLNQLSELFERDKSVISRHIKSVYQEEELDYTSTVAKNATVQKEGKREVERTIEYYNLDLVISVGYRVNSKRGVQFRQWATQRLKDHLVQGFTINQKRLDELQQTVQLIQKSISTETNLDEAKGLLEVISQYTHSFSLLSHYDSNSIPTTHLNEVITFEIDYPEAKSAIETLKNNLIAKEKLLNFLEMKKIKVLKEH